MTVEIVQSAFDRGLRDVDEGVDVLRAHRDRLTRRVDALLDGGWSGPAATAFAGVWTEWCRGSHDVLAGLTALGELMRVAEAGLHTSDAGSAVRLQEVSARILERLGR